MGVLVIENESDDDCSACYACGATASTKTSNSSAGNASNIKHPAKTYTKAHNGLKTDTTTTKNTCNRPTKDLVGNCKEFRIEHNKYDLRIIGNGNRVRIGSNVGNLHLIGNATRLKIRQNGGHIKYTGNDGRICLGNDSKHQLVDYIGCNGILKIVDAMELSLLGKRDKCKTATKPKTTARDKKDSSLPTGNAKSPAAPTPVKTKSASYAGCDWQEQFSELFQRKNWQKFANISMPNLKENFNNFNNCNCNSNKTAIPSCNISNNINVAHSVGNIVINNSVNVTI